MKTIPVKRAKMTPEEKAKFNAEARQRKRDQMSPEEKAEAKAKAGKTRSKKRAKKDIPDLVESWLITMKEKAHKTTKTSSEKKTEPTKVTPEKSAKLSPKEIKELRRAKRKLALTEEAEANSV